MNRKASILTWFWGTALAGFILPAFVYQVLARIIAGRQPWSFFASGENLFLFAGLHTVPFVVLAIFLIVNLNNGWKKSEASYRLRHFGAAGSVLLLVTASALMVLPNFIHPQSLGGLAVVVFLVLCVPVIAVGYGLGAMAAKLTSRT